jgi:hypothetical protein
MTEQEEGKKEHCLLCAWRRNCQKKHSIKTSPYMHCPHFEKDISLYRKSDCRKDEHSE